MSLSSFTAYDGDIAEGSSATPGLFNRRFSTLSQNLDQLNTDADSASGVSTSRLTIATTLLGVPAATVLYNTNTNNALNGLAIYRAQSNGTSPPDADDALGYIILGGATGAGTYRNTLQMAGFAEGTWGASSGPARLEFRNDGTRVLSLTSSAVSSHITTKVSKGEIALADGTYLAPSLTFDSSKSGGFYYDGSSARWVQAGTTAAIFPLVDGTITLGRVDYGVTISGPVSADTLTLNKEPSSASHAASKNYVDTKVSTYTGATAATISAANVTDGSFAGEYQFSRTTSVLTIAGDVAGQKQYVANTVGPVYPAFVGSQRSFGFGFSASNNYPMVTMSGVTQALWDSTSLNITSDVSMVNTSKRVRLGVGSAIAPSIVIGSNESTGFYFNSSGTVLSATVEGQQAFSLQSSDGKIIGIFGASGANNNELTITGVSTTTKAFVFNGTLGSGTSRAIVYHNGLAAALLFDIQKGASVTSTFLKLEHSSTASHTGLYLYDPSSPSMTPVVVLPNDTGATGFRALAVPNA